MKEGRKEGRVPRRRKEERKEGRFVKEERGEDGGRNG